MQIDVSDIRNNKSITYESGNCDICNGSEPIKIIKLVPWYSDVPIAAIKLCAICSLRVSEALID